MPYRKPYRRGVPSTRRPNPKPATPAIVKDDRYAYPEGELARVQEEFGGVWLAYTNLWTKARQVYKPATGGTFVYAFREGQDGKLEGTNREIGLGYGCVSAPQRVFTAILADFAYLLAKYPELEGRLAIYCVPCVFSSREGWVEMPYVIPEELYQDAQETAANAIRSSWYGYYDSYKQRHGIGSTYH